jgi:DNA polymerase-3 subunit gamma/tau
VLAALQILAEARGRLRGSPHGRLVVELALVRVARLENLVELSELIGRLAALEAGATAPPGAAVTAPSSGKKKLGPPEPAADGPRHEPLSPPTGTAVGELDLESVRQIWPRLLKDKELGMRLGMPLSVVKPTAVESPNVLVIGLPADYNWVADQCEEPEARSRIEEILTRLLHRPMTLRFDRAAAEKGPASPATATASRRRPDLESDPLVRKVVELFEARPVHWEPEEDLPESPGR